MTELERRALLGDREAQKECTEKGIVLPCPCCSGNNIKYESYLLKGVYDSDFFCEDCFCSVSVCADIDDPIERRREALGLWNTRPAPPIGRCGECKEYDTENCSEGCGWCQVWDIGRFDDGFCDKFKSKERE